MLYAYQLAIIRESWVTPSLRDAIITAGNLSSNVPSTYFSAQAKPAAHWAQ